MSRLKMTLILVAVTMSITGLHGQNEKAEAEKTNETAQTELSDFDFDFDFNFDFNFTTDIRKAARETRALVNEEIRDINVNRKRKRVTRRNNFWNRSWALDRYYPRKGTDNFVNVYVGLNNWLEDGDLPNSDALYSLSPINSWYLGVNFDNISKMFGPLYLDWGVGASFVNFAFENTRVRVDREVVGDPGAVFFTEIADIRGRRSKITATYLNVHFVPTLSFGRYNSFRVGFGIYGGYRLGSSTRMVFDDANGDKQRDKVSDSFHINPFRYGYRAQVGWDFFDLFLQYDLTDFFDEDVNAPRLTPVTFGVIF